MPFAKKRKSHASILWRLNMGVTFKNMICAYLQIEGKGHVPKAGKVPTGLCSTWGSPSWIWSRSEKPAKRRGFLEVLDSKCRSSANWVVGCRPFRAVEIEGREAISTVNKSASNDSDTVESRDRWRYRNTKPLSIGAVMTEVTVSPKYQIVIPKEIRESMGIVSGQKVQIMSYKGRIEVIPLQPMKAMKGFLEGIDTTVARDADRV